MSRVSAMASTASVVLLLSGCTSMLVGTATPDPVGSQPVITADPTPAPEISDASLVEAQRIAGATVLPEFIHPELIDNCSPTEPLIDPARLEETLFGNGAAASIYTRYGFVAGWITCRDTADAGRSAVVFLAEMSDPDSATAAAQEMAAKLIELNGAESTEIRGFANVPAVRTRSAAAGPDSLVIEVFLPVGRMLAYFAYRDTDLAAAENDVGELLEEQRQLLGDFEPTPQNDIDDLDSDVFDLARRTADPPATQDLYSGSYNLAGYLHLAISSRIEANLLPDNGFEGFFRKSAEDDASGMGYQFQVYKLGSEAEAEAVLAEFARIELEEFSDRATVTFPEDPTIPCFVISGIEPADPVQQRCYTREGRFLARTDILGVTDPADLTAMRGYVQRQIELLRAP